VIARGDKEVEPKAATWRLPLCRGTDKGKVLDFQAVRCQFITSIPGKGLSPLEIPGQLRGWISFLRDPLRRPRRKRGGAQWSAKADGSRHELALPNKT
jgi:hypothetical protein